MKQKQDIMRYEYYGAANTAYGFYNLFDKIFSPEKLKRIYILKGGPGCGKSTTMRKISDKATKLGYKVENYYCSSSPSSFDGVIIPELSVAVLDGTAPHSFEPTYPAVCETIVDLGRAWDTKKAELINQEIRELSKKKKQAYTKAYAYLSACLGANSIIRSCTSQYILKNKLERSVERLCSKLKLDDKENGSIEEVFTDCNSGAGNVHLPTFENLAETKYFIKDFGNITKVYFECLKNQLLKRGADITVALDPVEPEYISGIFIKEQKICFTMYNDDFALSLDRKQELYKIINTARFCDTSKYKKQRVFYKYAEKSRKNLYAGALRELKCAGDAHEEMEKLYYTITDYTKVEEIANDLEKQIFE